MDNEKTFFEQIAWQKYITGQTLTYEERMVALTIEEQQKEVFNKLFGK